MMMKRLRVVFDCMIFLQAVLSEKSIAFRLFEHLEADSFTLFVSREIFDEVNDVLNRQSTRARYRQVTDEIIEKFLNRVSEKSRFYKNCFA